jgi:hypothetical protein
MLKIKLFFSQEYFQSLIVRWLLFFGGLFNLVSWVVLNFFLPSSGKSIILHYNVYFGVDSIGNSQEAYALAFIGMLILVFNSFLALYFYKQKERIASYILLITALMVQLSLLISIISVIIINY